MEEIDQQHDNDQSEKTSLFQQQSEKINELDMQVKSAKPFHAFNIDLKFCQSYLKCL